MPPTTDSPAHPAVVLLRQLWLQLKAHKCLQEASSLAFHTLMSLIPLSAVGLLLLKTLGVLESEESKLIQYIRDYFLPNHQAFDIASNLSEFATRNQERLTVAGFLFLLFILMALFNGVESIFNDIWKVQRPTNYLRRFATFYTILTVSPLLLWLSISASTNWLFVYLLPWLIVYAFFSLMYIALPNTYVDWKPALIGSLTAGTLFQTARFIFSHYLGLGFDDRHTQIYGVLSSIIILAIWVYLVWLIVILGAEITNIVQKYQAGGFRDLNPHFGRNSEDLLVNPMLAVQIFLAIASRFAEAETACSKSDLLKAGFSSDLVDQVVDKLKSSGILYETKEDLIIPAKPLSRISLVDVLTTFDWHYIIQDDARYSSNLRQALEQLRQIHSQILGTESIEYYLPEEAELP